MGEGLIPTTARGYGNLAFAICMICCVTVLIAAFFSSRYRIFKVAVPFSYPPRTEYRIYGRWPDSLILYGVASTEKEAEELVKQLDMAWKEPSRHPPSPDPHRRG